MYNLLLEEGVGAGAGLFIVLMVFIAILGVLAGGGAIFATVARWILIIRYKKYNRVKIENGLTAEQAARAFLDANGLTDVKIEKAGWFKGSFVGNHYNSDKNIIYLRSNIYGKTTITAIGLALQKVTQTIELRKQNSQDVKKRSKFQRLMIYSPILIIPVVLLGLVIDIIFTNQVGLGTIITSALSLVFYAFGIYGAYLGLKVEVRANKKTIEMLQNSNLMNPEELKALQKVYDSYKLSYIADFVLMIIKTVYEFLKLIYKILTFANNFKK